MHLSDDMLAFLGEQGIGPTTLAEIDGEIEAIREKSYDNGYSAGSRQAWSDARDSASTYNGGEGNHPLARHRDSMG